MTAPFTHRFRNKFPNDALGFANNADVAIYQSNQDRATAFEIGAGSDVDCVRIKGSNFEATIAVGCPIVGDFEGPFRFFPISGRMPLNTIFGVGSTIAYAEYPAVYEIVQHFACNPSLESQRRAPGIRAGAAQTVQTTYDTSAPLLVIPFYGRRRATFAIRSLITGVGGTTDVVFALAGLRNYTTGGAAGPMRETIDYGVAKDASELSRGMQVVAIVLDASGNKELTVLGTAWTAHPLAGITGSSPSVGISIVDESFMYLGLYAKSAASGTSWVMQATCEVHDG